MILNFFRIKPNMPRPRFSVEEDLKRVRDFFRKLFYILATLVLIIFHHNYISVFHQTDGAIYFYP